MKVVTFQNTQGVEVQYICSDALERFLAFLLDAVIVFFVIVLFQMAFASAGDTVDNFLNLFVYIPFIFFYNLGFEMFNDGRSLGKMIIGLKVVRVDGLPLKTNDLLLRWLFRAVDIMFSVGGLALVSISVTPRAQRIGDVMADTTVIRTKHRKTNLLRVTNLAKLGEHKPKYMKDPVFSEEQMLLMKETYERASKYPSPQNKQMVQELSHTVAKILGFKNPKNPSKFLMAVVKDYVTLTR